MTTTTELTKAALALSEYFGTRYDASRAGGRDTMAAVLNAQFDLSAGKAAALLDTLEQSSAIRWIPQAGTEWMHNRLGLPFEPGYWQLESPRLNWEQWVCANETCAAEAWMVRGDGAAYELWQIAAQADHTPFMVAATQPICPRCGRVLSPPTEPGGY